MKHIKRYKIFESQSNPGIDRLNLIIDDIEDIFIDLLDNKKYRIKISRPNKDDKYSHIMKQSILIHHIVKIGNKQEAFIIEKDEEIIDSIKRLFDYLSSTKTRKPLISIFERYAERYADDAINIPICELSECLDKNKTRTILIRF